MDLCDHCKQPKMLHGGFNHGTNKCIVVDSWIGLVILFGSDRATEIVQEIREWQSKGKEEVTPCPEAWEW